MTKINQFAIALVLLASACFAQTQTLSTTTLGAAVTAPASGIPQTTWTFASTSTMQNAGPQGQVNTAGYVDKELFFVTTVVDSTHAIVQRAKGGGAGGIITNHASGAKVYFANTVGAGTTTPTAAPAFFSNKQTTAENYGSCSAGTLLALPLIYPYSGDIFDCKRTGAAGTSGQWILVGNGTSGSAGERISGFCTGTVGSAETEYLNGAACSGATTLTARQIVATAGTLANLRVVSSAAFVGTGGTATTVFKNGSATALTCSAAAAATTCSDTTHSVPVVPGDVIAFQNISATSDTAANVSAVVGVY